VHVSQTRAYFARRGNHVFLPHGTPSPPLARHTGVGARGERIL